MTLAQYTGLFRRRRLALLSRAAPDDHAVGVAATWDMSLDQIALRSAAAADLLELCAALGPARVPLELLARRRQSSTGRSSTSSATSCSSRTPSPSCCGSRWSSVAATACACTRCCGPSCSAARTTTHSPGPGCGRIGPDRGDARRPRRICDVVAVGVVGTTRPGPRRPPRGGGRRRARRATPGQRGPLPQRPRALPAGPGRRTARAGLRHHRVGNADPRLVPHQTHLGLVHERLGDLAAARHLQDEALALLRSAAPRDPLLEAVTLMRLGGVLACRRDLPPALDAFQQALAVLARVDAPHETGRCLTEVALVQWMSGHPLPARAHFERAIAVLDAAVGSEHPDAAHARSGPRWSCRTWTGRGGARSAVGGRAAFTQARGPVHPDVAHAHDKLAYMVRPAGRLHRAGLEGHGRALAILQDVTARPRGARHAPDQHGRGAPDPR